MEEDPNYKTIKRTEKLRVRDRETVEEILKNCDVCRIALNAGGGQAPYIVPMNFGYEYDDDGLILWIHCAKKGRKLDLIAENPLAGLEMDTDHELRTSEATSCEYGMNYSSLIGEGRISVADESEKMHGLECIMAHYGGGGLPFDQAVVAKTCVLRLDVTDISGKRLQWVFAKK